MTAGLGPTDPSRLPNPLLIPPWFLPRHNDLPWQLLTLFNNKLQDQEADLNTLSKTHTNIPKLKAGFVGGQVHPPICSLMGSPLHSLWD